MSLELLGFAAVDSGQILIVDPCYIKTDGEQAWQEDWNGASPGYGVCCEATLSANRAAEVLIAGVGGTGVAVGTSYGDGNYPVYRDGDKIIIDFNPEMSIDAEGVITVVPEVQS